MTHQPPLPDAAVPPYPLHPEPHDESGPAFFTNDATKEDDETARYSLAGRAPIVDALTSNPTITIGAAIGLGVAAIAGLLLYGRAKAEEPPARPARRPRSAGASKASAAKPRTTKPRASKSRATAAKPASK